MPARGSSGPTSHRSEPRTRRAQLLLGVTLLQASACAGAATLRFTGDDAGASGELDGRTSSDASAGGLVDGAANDDALPIQLVPGTGGPVFDASAGHDPHFLACGPTSCPLQAETCCVYPILAPPPPFYFACSNGGSCPALEAGYDAGPPTELHCEAREHCPANNVCCIVASPSSGRIVAHCLHANACLATGGTPGAQLCDPLATDPGCGDKGACSSANIATWHLSNGFATCGGLAHR